MKRKEKKDLVEKKEKKERKGERGRGIRSSVMKLARSPKKQTDRGSGIIRQVLISQ